MLIDDEARIADILACPACRTALASDGDRRVCVHPGCRLEHRPFDQLDGKSLLVDFAHSILQRTAMLDSGGASVVRREEGAREKLLGRLYGGNPIAAHFADAIVADLERRGRAEGRRPVLLIVGGGAVGSGAGALTASPDIDVVSFDIYWSRDVTFLADGHAIPLTTGSVDAVWVQAVLEHVADPIDVVAEITRVLRPGGLVFADTPFLWPVHERAYDFTRWTPSGHRWLFRDYDVLAAGTSSGPGMVFILSLRHLIASLTRSTKLGHLLAAPFFWVRFLDRWCDARTGLDAAAGIFFYGRKANAPLDRAGLVRFHDEQIALEERVPSYRR